jgi:hypothetical protein
MSMAAFKERIEAFGRSIGLQGAVPDDEGYCAMSFDDLTVHFQYDDGDATIFSRLGEVDEDRLEGIYGMLLAANMFWQGTKGATLSVEPDSRIVFIATHKPVEALTDEAFRIWLGSFVDIADYWQRRLATANSGGPLEDGDDATAPDAPSGAPMIRV